MGRVDTRNPLAQLSSLISFPPRGIFPVVLPPFLATIAIVPPFLSVGGNR